MLFPLILATLQTVASSPRADSPLPSHPFLEQLAARDACITSMVLPFRSELTAWPGCAYVEQGTWVAKGKARSAFVMRGCLSEPPELVWECWDGSRNRLALGEGKWEEFSADGGPRPESYSSLAVSRKPYSDLLASATLPNQLAGFPIHMKWSEYLKQMSDIVILEEQRIGDRAVVPLIFDMDGSKRDGLYQHPWIVEFDKSRLVPLRVRNFVLNEKSVHGDPMPSAELPQLLSVSRWTSNLYFEVQAVHEVTRGVWIGTEARMRASFQTHAQQARITIDKAKVQCNSEVPDTWLEVRAAPGVKEVGSSLNGDPIK